MNANNIEIGKVYRMKGRKLDRRVLDILSLPDLDAAGNYKGEYRMVVVEILSAKPSAPVKEYLPWFASDVICELRSIPPSESEAP